MVCSREIRCSRTTLGENWTREAEVWVAGLEENDK
jgi:hypothetical protein